MSVIVELSIFPIGEGESVSGHVARAVEIIRRSGVRHELGPMGTCLEGEWDEIMSVVAACREALHEHASRVYMTLKVDSRLGRDDGLNTKTQAVEAALKR